MFSPTAWKQYTEWQTTDRNVIKKINDLIQDIQRNGFSSGIGKPEMLKARKAWSRRINQEHRLIYVGDENQNLLIITCNSINRNLIYFIFNSFFF
ncbi:Txe/YoeB family addiction module toxin [Synergistaceae bacterium OttesenSCG-928-I11]|nr:Txe/YoeB family addiction module toxin [Synergistaceae bacterium OttesenSCG-928-I11]